MRPARRKPGASASHSFQRIEDIAMTTPSINPAGVRAVPTASSIALQLASAAALGVVLLYGVAFAESPVAHNAAHDVRHVTVKPCH
jgi:cobalt transporter subunit CbtB